MDHAHHILRGVAEAQPGAAANFNERCKSRPDYASLRLVECPDVDHRVEPLVRGLALESGQLLLPIALQRGKLPVDIVQNGILAPDLLSFFPWSHTQHEDQTGFLAGRDDNLLLQSSAVVSAQLGAALASSLLDGKRIRFRTVVAQKAVAHGVITVRLEVAGKIMEGRGFVEEVVFDHAILIAGPAGVQAHLQILIVDLNVMKREFHIAVDAQPARLRARIRDFQIPQFYVVVERDKQRLLRVDILIVAGKL